MGRRHLARGPVDDHLPAVVQARGRGQPTTAGMPSCLARIAVWLVGPPSSVTKPRTCAGSSTAVSAGARSSATSTDGSARTVRRASAHREQGDRAMPDVLEIRNPLAEIAADRAQCLGESEKPLVHGPSRRAAARHEGGDLLVELRILRHHRLGLEDVLRGTARSGATSPQKAGDVGERGNGPFGLQLRVLDRAARRRIRWRRGEPDHGAGDRPRTHPDSVQDLRHHRLTSTLMVIGSGTSGSRPSCGRAAPTRPEQR